MAKVRRIPWEDIEPLLRPEGTHQFQGMLQVSGSHTYLHAYNRASARKHARLCARTHRRAQAASHKQIDGAARDVTIRLMREAELDRTLRDFTECQCVVACTSPEEIDVPLSTN
jgi:hypothetical protein